MKNFMMFVFTAFMALSACSAGNDLDLKGQASTLSIEYPVGLLNARKRYDRVKDLYVIKGYIEVTDLSFNKEVTVVYRVGDGGWTSVAATYHAETLNAKEAWYFETAGHADQTQVVEFAIEYKVNGQTYWDNNYGQNYKIGPDWFDPDTVPGTILGRQNVVLYASYYTLRFGHLSGNVMVKNIGHAKTVQLIWTTNDWQSSAVIDCNYTLATEPGSDTEMWSFSKSFEPGTVVEYAISYQVNGQNYWDNFYGANYIAE